jgi:hypothetical protein
MSYKYFFAVALAPVFLFGTWITTLAKNPGDVGFSARSLSRLVFTNNYPVNDQGWVSPQEIFQPDGSRTVFLHQDTDWRLMRHWPSGYLDVAYRKDAENWTRIELGLAWRRSQIPLLTIASADRKEFYVVTYDAVTNIPSGRSLTPQSEGLDIYRITSNSRGEPERIASALPLGGFDARLFAKQSGKAITLCGGNRCLTIDGKGSVKHWVLDEIKNHEIIELVFVDDTKAYALTRLKHTDLHQGEHSKQFAAYHFFALSPGASKALSTISDGGVPWGLTIENDTPVLRVATNAKEMRALLQWELSLMPFGGVMDYGSNNLEGRVAWSSVYYLNGLMSLVAEHDWLSESDRGVLRERLVRELELIALLGQSAYPNYLSKRYSVDREPILFALHVGRVLQLLARAERYGINSKALADARDMMCKTLMKLETTVEETRKLSEDSLYSFYRKGFPFWGDGANVPYNYVSGVIAGRLEAGCISVNEARKFLHSILLNEFGHSSFPEKWRYWWGVADDGWLESDYISLNTPAYKGNGKGVAHISYLSMDVAALLLYGQLGGELPNGFNEHVERLVARGSLYPLLNEILTR